jgi:hypothetical protein
VPGTDPIDETVNAVYLSDSRRVLATLIRLLGDFDVAEEALHDAFRAALEQWPRDGVPANPRAWLVSPAASRQSTGSGAGHASMRWTKSPTRPTWRWTIARHGPTPRAWMTIASA